MFIELINAHDTEIKVLVRPTGKLPFGRHSNLVNASWAERAEKVSGGKFRVLTLHTVFHRILCRFLTCSCKVLLGQCDNDGAFFFFSS